MDEWDNKNNGTGPDAEQTDSANDTHIENNADQMPPLYAASPLPELLRGGRLLSAGRPFSKPARAAAYQSPYQYNQAPASGGGPDGSGPQKKKKKTGLIVLIVILCVALVAAGIGIAIGLTRDDDGDSGNKAVNPDGPTLAIEETPDSQSTTNEKGELTAEEVAKKVKPSIVGVIVSETAQNNMMGQNQSESGEGTGIIMGEDKTGKYTYIITCAHVISGNNVKATVQLEDGTSYDADVVGYDERSDVGVLRIKASGLQAATFGDSSKLAVGQQVFAIGNPLGTEFFGTLTGGFVSAIDRPISSEIGYPMKCIQHDAAINPGNSGGALVNMYGQVIGINSSKIAEGYEGIGFAIPINSAKEIVDKLIANGYVPGRPKLGVTYYAASQQSSYRMIVQLTDLPAGTLVIKSIGSDSDLVNTDAKAGDMIIAVNGKNLDNSNTLLELIEESKVGDTLTLTLCRIDNNYKTSKFDVKVKLVEDKGSSSSNEATESSTTNTYFNPFGF